MTEAQPGSVDSQRARRPHSLRKPAAGADAGETIQAPAEAAGAGAGDRPAVAAPDAASPLNDLLKRLGLAQAEALVRRRPEVGLGIAFAGGLLAATILKRLGRR